jgi:hypothetical protein
MVVESKERRVDLKLAAKTWKGCAPFLEEKFNE